MASCASARSICWRATSVCARLRHSRADVDAGRLPGQERETIGCLFEPTDEVHQVGRALIEQQPSRMVRARRKPDGLFHVRQRVLVGVNRLRSLRCLLVPTRRFLFVAGLFEVPRDDGVVGVRFVSQQRRQGQVKAPALAGEHSLVDDVLHHGVNELQVVRPCRFDQLPFE